jgi:membrane-associated phospholipid phosphatase
VTLALVLLEAFDRLYLEVHWESDVIGGLLLGATFLAASISWLEWSEARSSA